MICENCKKEMRMDYFQIPSGKDKEELASFIYFCDECKIEIVLEGKLGDKGGM